MSPEVKSLRQEQWPWVAYAVLVLFALVVRLAGIGRWEMWLDEACSVVMATSPAGIWHELRVDTNAPLYFLLLKGWIAIWGMGPAAVRSLSALFGAGAVAGIGLGLRACNARWSTALWGMALCAVAPLQLFYSQEARPYAMLSFFVVIAFWTFVRAVKFGRAGDWAGHAAAALCGLYTHHFFVPWMAGLGLALLFLRPPARIWKGALATWAIVAVLYVPGAILLWHQVDTSGGADWIAKIWRQTPLLWAIPQSLESLSMGGELPVYFSGLPLGPVWTWIGLVIVALAGGAAITSRESSRELGHWRWVLVILAVWPLVFLWAYSALRHPIYVVGRYDICAQPAYLGLLAVGMAAMTDRRVGSTMARAFSALSWCLGCVLLILMGHLLGTRWSAPTDDQGHERTLRAEFLQRWTSDRDVMVCTELEAASTLYECRRRGIPGEVRTLPADTLTHFGWEEPVERLTAETHEIEEQTGALIDEMDRHGVRRLWIVIRPAGKLPWESGESTFGDYVAAQLIARAEARGWREGAGSRQLSGTIRVAWLERNAVSSEK
jgi:hypothetical protein